MKLTSLATIVLSAAVMTIASESDPSPLHKHCAPANTMQCKKDLNGFNSFNDYAIWCGPESQVDEYAECPCQGCCRVADDGKSTNCKGN
ncbi:uncharacterized protein EDB93DRAFT_1191909 [Suillus bovinus]|uniref:uncharacterized protein n=1 Tax=Suillus bovinus TaxID=48563 RepID=UPI001B863935|nr:uncharacterized protein EDB93DRAFT_1191909 [Suillus bovinus]KAG2125182.1 hypothetical protein EDB93DRAFT_1191909 [Suillus bovinus]